MSCAKREVARSSVGSVKICECGMVSIECNGNVIEVPRAAFSSFAGMIDVACVNIIARGLNESIKSPHLCRN